MNNIEARTTEELNEIYNNLMTGVRICGYASPYDSEMIAAIEIELAKRNNK